MRGWFLLAALLLLPFTPPAQAALLDLDREVSIGDRERDPCLDVMGAVHDPGHALDNPETVLYFASHCTFNAAVSLEQTQDRTAIMIDADPVKILIESVRENGTLVITIAVAVAEHGEAYVFRCSDPDRLPQAGDALVMDASCWSVDEWLRID